MYCPEVGVYTDPRQGAAHCFSVGQCKLYDVRLYDVRSYDVRLAFEMPHLHRDEHNKTKLKNLKQ